MVNKDVFYWYQLQLIKLAVEISSVFNIDLQQVKPSHVFSVIFVQINLFLDKPGGKHFSLSTWTSASASELLFATFSRVFWFNFI